MGLTVRDMTMFLETMAPLSYQEEYDNSGLLVGRGEAAVHKVMLAVDASESVIEQTIANQCEMLITHHPLIFHPLKKVTEEDPVGKRVLTLAEHGIALYAAHTNMDSAPGGNIDFAARQLGLQNIYAAGEEGEIRCLRVGFLEEAKTLRALAEKVKEVFGLAGVRLFGDPNSMVRNVAIVTGSGMDFAKTAMQEGADVLVTGDITYHKAEEALREGLRLIDASHFGTDKLSEKWLRRALGRMAAEKSEPLEIYTADEKDVYTLV